MRLPNHLAPILFVAACWGCAGSSIRPGARPRVAAVPPPAMAPPTTAATPVANATPATAETPAPAETQAPAETASKFETIFGLDAVVEDATGCVGAAAPQSTSDAPAPCMRRVLPPEFVPSKHGDIDKNIVRSIIQSHIDEVKACYEAELEKRPTLGGRVMVQFTIGASGEVIASVLQDSTMGNAKLENCTVRAVRRWRFPKVLGGGIVVVAYPFVLTPAGPPGGPVGP